jgi:hypothetical protein
MLSARIDVAPPISGLLTLLDGGKTSRSLLKTKNAGVANISYELR